MKSSRQWINLRTWVRIVGNLTELQTGYFQYKRLNYYNYTSLPDDFYYKTLILFTRQGYTFSQLASLWHLAPCSLRHTECIASSHGATVELLRTRWADYRCIHAYTSMSLCCFVLSTGNQPSLCRTSEHLIIYQRQLWCLLTCTHNECLTGWR